MDLDAAGADQAYQRALWAAKELRDSLEAIWQIEQPLLPTKAGHRTVFEYELERRRREAANTHHWLSMLLGLGEP